MKPILLIAICIVFILGVLTVNEHRNDAARLASAEEDVKLGERIYQENCAACHGDKGDGKGPQADRLSTKPRNFTTGIYKFRTTPSGSLPLDQDILTTVTQGVRGTSMLAQLQLSGHERWAVVQYLKTFSPRFNEEKPGHAIAYRRLRRGTPSSSLAGNQTMKKQAARNVMVRTVKVTAHRRRI